MFHALKRANKKKVHVGGQLEDVAVWDGLCSLLFIFILLVVCSFNWLICKCLTCKRGC